MLKWVLKIGKILAMTPTRAQEKYFPHRTHAYIMTVIYGVFFSVSLFYRLPHYLRSLKAMNLLVQIILDGILITLNIYTVFATVSKRYQWCKLLKIDRERNSSSGCLTFIVANILFHLIHVYSSVVFTLLIGVDYFIQYGFEYLQLYSQFILYFLLYTILNKLVVRYVQLKATLSEGRPMIPLQVLKNEIVNLRESVDAFNDIFGWPFLLVIMFTSFQIMVYLQGIFVGSTKSLATIFSSVNVILWQSVCTFYNILLCDSVAHTAGEVLNLVYAFDLVEMKHAEDLNEFITAVKDNFPVFVAARFFVITRKTIFSMFNAIITFLIVMIQFEMNYSEKQCNATTA
nr:PREDICTED: gustatory and pheromone receptor 39a, isoform D [Tribolium castaneum]|eukprot:XP_008199588.1 PREDICTED: gustatory and pheromone receptor 39a, isoform D [Tribolium castaneum]